MSASSRHAPHALSGVTAPVAVVTLIGFLFGFDVAVIAGMLGPVQREFALGDWQQGWLVASLTLTATLAMLLAGPLADRYGRRALLRIAAVVFAVSALVAALAPNYSVLVLGRMMSGAGVGASLVAAPLYLAEIAPARRRGAMVSLSQLFVVTGMCAAYGCNYWAGDQWRWMVGVGVVPAAILSGLLLGVPESPRWLVLRGHVDAARRVLARVRAAEDVEPELAAMLASTSVRADASLAPLRERWQELLSPGLRAVLAGALVVAVLQQITGINAVLFYAPVIFKLAGTGSESALLQALWLGVVNALATVLALLLIDRVGRRPLLLFGTAGIAASLAVLAIGFHGATPRPGWVLAGTLGFVACFAASLGPGMWVVLAEIFPNRVRALALSVLGLTNSAVSFIVQLLFPWQLRTQGASAPWLWYGAFALVGLLLMLRWLPETRGRSLEELQDRLVRSG